MAVERAFNWLGQMRVDASHLRTLDSATCADFSLLAGTIMTGNRALIVSGFDVVQPSSAIGKAASSIQLNVAGATIMHALASEAGTIFQAPLTAPNEILNTANSKITGGFVANNVNYVGIDLRRTADPTTADLVEFLDPNTDTEIPEVVPLARTLQFIIIISNQDFSVLPGVLPLAKVTTDVNNFVTAIQDARSFMFRLGTGGSVPNTEYAYPWPLGRTEVGDDSDFTVADKAITSQKDWQDAVMTRLWELGGGTGWYSPTADRNVTLARIGNTTFTNGEYFYWDGTNLTWQGLRFLFDNSPGYYNDIKDQTTASAGLTNLLEGDCIYVDLNRKLDLDNTYPTNGQGPGLIAQKASLVTLGTPTIPGSRHIIAWRSNNNIWTTNGDFPVNSAYTPATGDTTLGQGALGIVRLTSRPMQDGGWANNFTPEVPVVDTNRKAILTGITRGSLSGVDAIITSGILSVGQGTNDTGLAVGQGTSFVSSFLGSLTVTPSGETTPVTTSGTAIIAIGKGSTNAPAIYGTTGASATLAYAIFGTTAAPNAVNYFDSAGVEGTYTSTFGSGAGVVGFGNAAGSDAAGVYGQGTDYGVMGIGATGSGGAGVFGNGDTTGVGGLFIGGNSGGFGVYAEATSTGARGVNALASDGFGLYAQNNSVTRQTIFATNTGAGTTAELTNSSFGVSTLLVNNGGLTPSTYGEAATFTATGTSLPAVVVSAGGVAQAATFKASTLTSHGTIEATNTGSGSGVLGTGGTGNGVSGSANSGYGVSGSSNSSYGVYGTSTSNNAIYGAGASTSASIVGYNSSTGTGVSGLSSGIGVLGMASGSLPGVEGQNTGSGSGGSFTSSSASPGLVGINTGSGEGAYFSNTSASVAAVQINAGGGAQSLSTNTGISVAGTVVVSGTSALNFTGTGHISGPTYITFIPIATPNIPNTLFADSANSNKLTWIDSGGTPHALY